ncbi:MAG: hypothetical protein H7A22_00135 [Spirochaetales bacterium]|nr:hypothetical protein [Spirochaetales bacterium]
MNSCFRSVAATLMLLLGPACLSFRPDDALRPNDGVPRSERVTVSYLFSADNFSNGSQASYPTELLQEGFVDGMFRSGLFRQPQQIQVYSFGQRPNSDYLLIAAVSRRERFNLLSGCLGLLTITVWPTIYETTLEVSIGFVDRSGRPAANITRQETVERYQQLFLMPVSVFAYQSTVESQVVSDLTLSILQEAEKRGLLSPQPETGPVAVAE